jgi:DNA-binding transcriptional LysR family regulator
LDAADLRIFETVARLGAMNRAARELNTVQSNVTARIRALEAELGVALFRRHSRGVAPTNAGLRLLPYARKVAALLDEAKRSARDGKTPSGPLTIGSLETTAAGRLPPILAAFAHAYPGVSLSLKVGTNATLIGQVLDHELDGAFVCAPVQHPGLKSDVVFREELVLAAGRQAGAVEAFAVPGCKILVKAPGCAYRDKLESWLESRGVFDYRRLEFGTIEAIAGCVEAGLGFTILPLSVLESLNRGTAMRLHKLPPSIANVDILFIRRHDVYEFRALRAFLLTALNDPDLSIKEISAI